MTQDPATIPDLFEAGLAKNTTGPGDRGDVWVMMFECLGVLRITPG